MKMLLHEFTIPLQKPFTISRGTTTVQETLIVELQHEGKSGYGEAAKNSFYGHSIASMRKSLEDVRSKVESTELTSGESIWDALHKALAGDQFALSALDIAAQDLSGKIQGVPCYQAWGLTWKDVCQSCITIGIDTPEAMAAEIKLYPGWNVYKVKLGTPQDIEIVQALRAVTDATFRIDANCAWTADETIANSHQLKELGVEFIEQPLPREAARADHKKVFVESALPVLADESCQTEPDVALCHGAFHGINVKLSKCGGLTPAVRMLRHARSLGMQTMLGCMMESSVAISAGAQLLPLLDYADLDGTILMGSDVATGASIDRGVVTLSDVNGTGVELLPSRSQFAVPG